MFVYQNLILWMRFCSDINRLIRYLLNVPNQMIMNIELWWTKGRGCGTFKYSVPAYVRSGWVDTWKTSGYQITGSRF